MHASAGLTTVIHEVRPYLGEGVRGRLTMPADRLCAVVADPAPVGTDPWWREVARLGTPLRVPGPGGTDLTLFLHRSADAAAVYLDVRPFTDLEPADGLMERVPGTDIWWAAYATGPEWVSGYGFVELDEVPAVPGPDAAARATWRGGLGTTVADPLNAVPAHRGERGGSWSVARGPRALRRPVPRGDDARGVLERHVWGRAGQERPVWTYVPAGAADAGLALPLVLLHDGAAWAEQRDAAGLFDALVARRDLPLFVGVLVGPPDQATPDEDGSPSCDALADDLLPDVTRRLAARGVAVTTDPALTVVVGQRLGGLAALQAVRHRPDRFGHAVGQSASLPRPDAETAAWLRAAPRGAGRVVLQVGTHEDAAGASRAVRDLLRARGEHVELGEVDGSDDGVWWSAHLGQGLADALADDWRALRYAG